MSSIAKSGETEDTAMLELLLSGKPAEVSQFSDHFLNAVPLEQLNAILVDLTARIGAPISISWSGGDYEILSASHRMSATITLDEQGRIIGLFFRPPVALAASLSDILAPLTNLGGTISYLIMQGNNILAQKDADKSLAIGSAFKLAILKVLKEDIEAEKRAWDDVVILSKGHFSLPSGILQDFPANAPLTLHTLAALMISQSDNTATDMLLELVGRDRVSAYLEGDFVLSTREFFQLKGDPDLADRFLIGNLQEKMQISQLLREQELPPTSVGTVPYKNGLEWYLSATSLCALMQSLSELDVFSINPGPANTSDWARIAYKGGSELGVLNLTTMVEANDGPPTCVVFTANAKAALPETDIINAYGTLLSYLANTD